MGLVLVLGVGNRFGAGLQRGRLCKAKKVLHFPQNKGLELRALFQHLGEKEAGALSVSGLQLSCAVWEITQMH